MTTKQNFVCKGSGNWPASLGRAEMTCVCGRVFERHELVGRDDAFPAHETPRRLDVISTVENAPMGIKAVPVATQCANTLTALPALPAGLRLGGDANGTSLQGYMAASFIELRSILGDPNSEGDGYKVSTEWTLTLPSGRVVTLYDYKETSMYDDGYPSVAEFRARPQHDWHIGGRDKTVVNELGDLFPQFKTIGCW